MFEKEAEEYREEWQNKGYYFVSQEMEQIELDDIVDATFKDGAEFGYNKANEWHKPSEKLPKECSLVLAYSFEDTEPALWEFVTSDQWEWLPKRIVFCSNDQIRLWKEIVLPELPKEIKE